jgi:hypothetical protein
MARTAVVAGTATAVSNRVSRRQAGRWAAQEQESYAPPPPQSSTGGSDPIEQLKELAALKQQGVLTDEEFAEQKARILA